MGDAYAVLGIGLSGQERYDDFCRSACDYHAARNAKFTALAAYWIVRAYTIRRCRPETGDRFEPERRPFSQKYSNCIRQSRSNGRTDAYTDPVTALREYDIAIRLNPEDADLIT